MRRVGRLGMTWLTVVAFSVAGATAGGIMIVVAAATPAAADPIGDCSTTIGVIVAVDFTAWGGNIERGCDATLTSGFDALHAAGFTTADDAQDGPTFICRIDDEPSAAEDACITTPPADAYWSYWHADVGQDTWSYSQVGAVSYHPPAGSVDAWTFGATDIDGTDAQPTFPPSAVRATNTSVGSSSTTKSVAPTSTTAPAPSRAPPTAGGGGTTPSSVRPSSPSTTSARDPGTGQHSVTSTTDPETSTSTTSGRSEPAPAGGRRSAPRIVDAVPEAINRQTAGSPVPLLVGAGVVAALMGGAGIVAWRRRRIS